LGVKFLGALKYRNTTDSAITQSKSLDFPENIVRLNVYTKAVVVVNTINGVSASFSTKAF